MSSKWRVLSTGWVDSNIGRLALMGLAALMSSCSCGEDPPSKPPSFRVGGTIGGLAGSLTLQLNGTESLTQSENGSFSFQSLLEDQSPFTVAITAAPSEQECTLQGGQGTVNGADVTTVRVSCDQRRYTLGGTVDGLNAPLQLRLNEGETLSLTTNGRFTFQTKLPKGSSYTVKMVAQPQAHRCSFTNESESGSVTGNVESIAVRCTPWYSFTGTPTATWVIGQENATSNEANRGGPTGQDTLTGPWGNPTLAGGKLYISDLGSTRILGFNGLPRQNITPAEFVLGQPDFTSTAQDAGRTGLANPSGTSSDGTRLAVADKNNNRVLLYLSLPVSTRAAADIVIGQPDFDSTASQCGGTSSLTLPENVLIGHGKLIVADTYNNRVLIWNAVPSSSGVPANLVLGQATFDTCAGNDKDGDGTLDADRLPNASTLWLPHGLWTDGTRLVVADTNNSRVLIWKQFPTNNGQPADVVLGQPGFTTQDTTTTQNGLNSPTFVNSTGQQLFVADTSNHRVMVWDEIPTQNNAMASVVLGQPDFLSSNQPDPPSAQSFYLPGGVLFAGPYVVVSDRGNNRLVVFESR